MSESVSGFGTRLKSFMELAMVLALVSVAAAAQTRIGKIAFVLLFTLAIGRTVL